jgi:hypothetical protein
VDQLRLFRNFIEQAEQVWTKVAHSPRGKPVYTVNGVDYTPLPPQYNTKRKISRFFRRYWGRNLAQAMIRNLQLRLVKGKWCIPYRVIPPLPMKVHSLRWKRNTPNQKLLAAILIGGNKKVPVDYRLVRSGATASFQIVKRSGRERDLRYRPSKAARPKAKPRVKTRQGPRKRRR